MAAKKLQQSDIPMDTCYSQQCNTAPVWVTPWPYEGAMEYGLDLPWCDECIGAWYLDVDGTGINLHDAVHKVKRPIKSYEQCLTEFEEEMWS